MSGTDAVTFEAKRRKLYATAKRIGLTRGDRLDLAEYVLRRDVASWSSFSVAEVDRMLDTLEGFALVYWLLTGRPDTGLQVAHSGVAQ